MTDETILEPTAAEAPTTAPDSAMLVSLSEIARRVDAEREKWEAEAAAERGSAQAQIRALEAELSRAKEEAARRDAELRCARQLQKHNLREEMAVLLLAPGESAPSDEELSRRADLLAAAVEEAAIRELRSRTAGLHPRTGTESPLTGALIRDTPIARLAELMGR